MKKPQKNKLLKVFTMVSVFGLGLTGCPSSYEEPADIKNKATTELDPITHKEAMSKRMQADKNVSNISNFQYHLLERSYTDLSITKEALLAAGFGNLNQRDSKIDKNIDLMLECRDKVHTTQSGLSTAYYRGLVIDCTNSTWDQVRQNGFTADIVKLPTAELNPILHEDLVNARITNDPYVGDPEPKKYVLLHKAMTDQKYTIKSLTDLGFTAYNNDKHKLEYNIGHVIECRDMLFPKYPSSDKEELTQMVRECSRAAAVKHYDAKYSDFPDLIPGLADPIKYKDALKSFHQKDYNDDIVEGLGTYKNYMMFDRAFYDPSVTLEQLKALDDDFKAYDPDEKELNYNMAYVFEARDELIAKEGQPDLNDPVAVKTFRDNVRKSALEKVIHVYDMVDFQDTPTSELDPVKHKRLLNKRMQEDAYVGGPSVEVYSLLEKAYIDPSITVQSFVDQAGVSEENNSVDDLENNISIVIQTRDKILKEHPNFSKTNLRNAVREQSFATTTKNKSESWNGLVDNFTTVASIAVPLGGVATLGIWGFNARQRKKKQEQRFKC